MKPTLLEQIWNGQISPFQNIEQNDPEILELSNLIEKNRKALDDCLIDEQKEKLEKLLYCQNDYYYLLVIQAFRMGFALSSQLVNETATVNI